MKAGTIAATSRSDIFQRPGGAHSAAQRRSLSVHTSCSPSSWYMRVPWKRSSAFSRSLLDPKGPAGDRVVEEGTGEHAGERRARPSW